MRRTILLSAALLAVTACRSLDRRDDVAAAVEPVSEARLRAHVEALVAIGPRPAADAEATRATLAYLRAQIEALGLAPIEERFSDGGFRRQLVRSEGGGAGYVATLGEPRDQVNLLVELPGTDPSLPVAEWGAHYDSVGLSPGADDNASGAAVLLEMARVLAAHRGERTVRLCFFAMEEEGLRGSRHHADRLAERPETRVDGIVVLDMVGFASRAAESQRDPVPGILFFLGFGDVADFLLVAGNNASGALGNLVEEAIDAYAPGLPYYSANRMAGMFEDSKRSDHANYWRHGMRGVLLSDTAEFRNPHYHRPSDLPETLDYAFMHSVARACSAAALHWARME